MTPSHAPPDAPAAGRPDAPPDAPETQPSRQARGERTRVRVLEATLRLLAREGPRAVTHRAVAAEAGTSSRATTYYFASREALLVEALQHYAEAAIARIDALAAGPAALRGDRGALVEAAARLLALIVQSDLGQDRTGLVAEYELVLEASRSPALEETYARWQARLEELLVRYATVMGSSSPPQDARIVLATLRGLEIEALARPSCPPTLDDLVGVFRRLLAGLSPYS